MQRHKHTIALLGALQPAGKQIAMAACPVYTLLLADDNRKELELLQQSLKTQYPDAIAELTDCAETAAWEADIIVITTTAGYQPSMAVKIERFSTRKTVIQVKAPGEKFVSLRQSLPHAKLASVQMEKEIAWIDGEDEEAVMTAAVLMDLCGLLPVCKQHSTNTK